MSDEAKPFTTEEEAKARVACHLLEPPGAEVCLRWAATLDAERARHAAEVASLNEKWQRYETDCNKRLQADSVFSGPTEEGKGNCVERYVGALRIRIAALQDEVEAKAELEAELRNR